MTYLGNSSLPPDVQQRIRSTFEHTLGLAEKGSRQEALLGCDFVLRMDPLFEPARRLQERLETASGPLVVDDLRRPEAAPAAPAAQPPSPPPGVPSSAATRPPTSPSAAPPAQLDPLWGDFDGLAAELPELPEAPARGPGRLREEFESLLAERRFQELQSRARQESAVVTGDLELQRMLSLAQERLEAGPYVSKFLLSAREALRNGNAVEASRLLEKAKSLDPTHPGIEELSAGLGGAPGVPPGAMGGSGATLRREPEMHTQPITGLPRPAAAFPAAASGAYANSTGAASSAAVARPAAVASSPAVAGPAAVAAPAGLASLAGASAPAGAASLAAVPAWTPPPATASPLAAGAATAPGSAPHLVPQPPLPPQIGDSESERRIQQLLAEGQTALEGGDPQAAIDVWSRIFLIDIDHQEAARRIENARRMKAERDRQVEETFHDGLARLEAHDLDAARHAFERVLELQPGHLPSREYLQQLDEGRLPAVPSGGRPTAAVRPLGSTSLRTTATPATPMAPIPPLPPDLVRAAGSPDQPLDRDLREEILVPPDLGKTGAHPPEARREARSASAGHTGRARQLFLVVGSAVLLLVLAVGWFVYQNWGQWFPNSRTEEPAQAPAPNPIPRATKLHDSGKVAMALMQLGRVAPGEPHYKEAQGLIARWQDEQSQAAQGAQTAQGAQGTQAAPGLVIAAPGNGAAAPGQANTAAAAAAAATPAPDRRQTLLEEARKAYGEGIYLLAAERYEVADRLSKLDPADATQLLQAKQKLVPLQRQVAMFRGHDWDFALPELWRLHESDPSNRDVTRMIVDCYYNLGVRDLQHNEVPKAAQKFTEAKTLAPGDPEVKRQLLFAQTYLERGPDLLYRIYVKYLPIR
jgi:tetratricopeptide (TPR) repeat protein